VNCACVGEIITIINENALNITHKNLSTVYVTPLLLPSSEQTMNDTEGFWVFQRRMVQLLLKKFGDLWLASFSGQFNLIDQKMRLTKGVETSSAVTLPYVAGRPRRLQYLVDRGESLKSG
jgi:hypothetical protein